MAAADAGQRPVEQGRQFRMARLNARIGLRELARQLNCAHSLISQVESGETAAPPWLAEVYAALTRGEPLSALPRRPPPERERTPPLLRKRLAVDETLVITVGVDGFAERYLHLVRLRALSSDVPAVRIRTIAVEQADHWQVSELEGGRVALGRRISGEVDVGVKFPVPLERREIHFLGVVFEPPAGETVAVRWSSPHYDLRRLNIRLWSPTQNVAGIIVHRLAGLEPHQPVRPSAEPARRPNANGLLLMTFTGLQPGFGYGITWQPL